MDVDSSCQRHCHVKHGLDSREMPRTKREARRHRGNAVADGDYLGGEQVSIRYFEGDAKAAMICSGFADTWLVPVIWTTIGLVIGIVALVMRPGR